RLVGTPAEEFEPSLSPDGRWLAYTSNESATSQVYVQSYPALDSRQQVSINGGTGPVWSHDGHRLFFAQEGQPQRTRLLSVDVKLGSSFSAGLPRLFLDLPREHLFVLPGVTPGYDVTLDGTRVVGIRIRSGQPP